jgi:integrase
VLSFFDHIPSLKYRAALMVCYGAGLRISEALALRVSDIDSKRGLLRVEQGKGAKDRYAMLSPRLLQVLRRYWCATHPADYLFPSWRKHYHLSTTSLQLACREAAARAGIAKRGHRPYPNRRLRHSTPPFRVHSF